MAESTDNSVSESLSNENSLGAEDMKYLVFSFVRHGETHGNLGIRLNCSDEGLTDHGDKQAKALGEKWKDLRIDALYSSDLARAMQTADHMAKANCKNPIPQERTFLLGEHDYGPVVDGLTKAGRSNEAWELRTGHNCGGLPERDYKPPGGESLNVVVERGFVFLRRMFNKYGVRRSNRISNSEIAAEWRTGELPEGIPHIVCVSHNIFLCELFEALESWHEEKHKSNTDVQYTNTGWTRHLIGLSVNRITQDEDKNESPWVPGSYARKYGYDLHNEVLMRVGHQRPILLPFF